MKSFFKDERGSFTMEATLVFPSVLIFTIIGVFFCIIVFQMGTANYVAQKAASELAFIWNNSQKDITTGEFNEDHYSGLGKGGDNLYWRLSDNNILSIFGLNSFPSEGPVADKIQKVKNKYNGSIRVKDVQYNNNLIHSEVVVVAESSLYVPSFITTLLGSDVVTAESSRVVTDTPELVRMYNFGKYLWSQFGTGGAVSEAITSIQSFFGGP